MKYALIIGILALFVVACSSTVPGEKVDVDPITNQTVTGEYEEDNATIPQFIQEHNQRFEKISVPPEDEWTPQLCIDLSSHVDEHGFYVDLPGKLEGWCKNQSICDGDNCTYISQVLKERFQINQVSFENRLNLGAINWANGYDAYNTPEKAIPVETKVFVYFNPGQARWFVVEDFILTDWIPEDVDDESLCDYVFWNDPTTLLQKERSVLSA